jgi:alkylhydroperoxidase family enzyme
MAPTWDYYLDFQGWHFRLWLATHQARSAWLGPIRFGTVRVQPGVGHRPNGFAGPAKPAMRRTFSSSRRSVAMIPVLPAEEALKRGKEVNIDERLASLNAFRMMLNSPRAAGAFAEMLRTLMFRNVVNARARELVILRIGWRTKSEYEFCQHVRVSRDLKMSEAEMHRVQRSRSRGHPDGRRVAR